MKPNLSDYELHKERLKQSAEELKKDLEVEIDHLKESAGKIGKVMLIAGGALFLTYSVVKAVRKKKAKKRKHKLEEQTYYPVPVKQSNIFAKRILEHITFFVLGMLRQKIVQYLEQRHEKKNY